MLQDLRSGLRQIHHYPAFAFAAILTLALGIGATAAVFTLADPMLFRPLPYPDSNRIVTARVTGKDMFGFLQISDYLRVEQQHQGFESIGTFWTSDVGRVEGSDDSVLAYAVTPGFLEVLGIEPMLGRRFLGSEFRTRPQPPDVALITWTLWQSAFGGRSDILDRRLELKGPGNRSYDIVEVLPRDFVFPEHVNRPPGFLLPGLQDPADQVNLNRGSGLVARLRPDVSTESARAELQAIVVGVERDFPQVPRERTVVLNRLQDALFGRVRTPLVMLLVATGCVLLLACANLAHLFMARLTAREREFGVRLAIGAGRWRLVRQLAVEAVLLAAAGGAAALVLAQWTFDVMMARSPEFVYVYRLLPARVDWRVAGFAAMLVSGALFIFALIPALRAARVDIRETLQSGGSVTPRRRGHKGSAALVLTQSAVAVALLTTSALVVRSFAQLALQPLGYEPQAVRTIGLELSAATGQPSDRESLAQTYRVIYRRLTERLGVPVAILGGIPGLTLPGGLDRPDVDGRSTRIAAYPASAAVFELFGIARTRGRFFDENEAFADAPVAVLDARAAETLWPNENPLGKQVRDTRGTVRTVIGISGTLRTNLVDHERGGGSAFVPIGATPSLPTLAFRPGRARITPEQVRDAVHEVDALAFVTTRPLRIFERTLGQPRFLAALLGTLGLLTVALTVVGIFGVVNHEVARRTREVGIRISLGADPDRIRRLVIGRALVPAAVGVVCGLVASLWWTRTLRSVLVGLDPHDAVTYAGSAVLVLLLVALASLMPAWRAARVEPTVALRSD